MKVKKLSTTIFIVLFLVLGTIFAPEAHAGIIIKAPAYLGLNRGLVGYWTFDGADIGNSGVTAKDKSGNSNNGTLTGANGLPISVAGKVGQALSFDGVDDYVPVYNQTIFQLTRGAVSAWIKTGNAGSSYRAIVVKQNAYGMFLKDNVLEIYDWGATLDRTTGINLADNAWHHVLFTFNSGVTNGTFMYIDGVLKLTTTMTVSAQATGLDIACGGLSVGTGDTCDHQFFQGSIDDVRLYNRALSSGEVSRLYNQTQSKYNSSQTDSLTRGLVGYWTFDGVDMGSSGTIAKDRSGNGYNGTLIGANGLPASVAGKVGQALNFDGVDDRISIARSITSPKNNISITAWIKRNSLTQKGVIIQKGVTNEDFDFAIDDTGQDDKLVLYMQTAGVDPVAYSTTLISDTNWHHVVVVRNGSTIKFYIDGVAAGTTSGLNTADLVNSAEASSIGSYITGTFLFSGSLDDVRLYNRALSAGEVSQLYQMGR